MGGFPPPSLSRPRSAGSAARDRVAPWPATGLRAGTLGSWTSRPLPAGRPEGAALAGWPGWRSGGGRCRRSGWSPAGRTRATRARRHPAGAGGWQRSSCARRTRHCPRPARPGHGRRRARPDRRAPRARRHRRHGPRGHGRHGRPGAAGLAGVVAVPRASAASAPTGRSRAPRTRPARTCGCTCGAAGRRRVESAALSSAEPGRALPGVRRRRDVVPHDGALDQPVGPVRGVVDDVRARGCPGRTPTGPAGSGACSAATAGSRRRRAPLQRRLAHRVQRLLQGEGVRRRERLEQRRPHAGEEASKSRSVPVYRQRAVTAVARIRSRVSARVVYWSRGKPQNSEPVVLRTTRSVSPASTCAPSPSTVTTAVRTSPPLRREGVVVRLPADGDPLPAVGLDRRPARR